MKKERKYWSGKFITTLENNQVFCMGTNPEGRHGAGAAKMGMKFGAQYGKGRGLVGNTYGLITKNLKAGFTEKETGITYQTEGYKSVSEFDIRKNIKYMYACAEQHPNKEFLLAYNYDTWANGSPKKSLNGYTSMEMANMLFDDQNVPDNMSFHESFKTVFDMKIEGKTPSEIISIMREQTKNLTQAGQSKREGMSKLKEAYSIAKETGNLRTATINPNGNPIESKPEHNGMDYNEAIKVDNQPRENFTFFWHSPSPFSQWHPSIFKVKDITFTSGEQFMMFCKAKLFKDEAVAQSILDINMSEHIFYDKEGIETHREDTVVKKFFTGQITKQDILGNYKLRKEWEGFQKEVKNLGRKVKNYDDPTWVKHRISYVAKGNFEKFTQNEDIKQELLNTDGTIMAEGNYFDKIWAIGIKESDPNATSPSKWKGLNLLGKILTNLREKFKYDLKQEESLKNKESQKKRKKLKR